MIPEPSANGVDSLLSRWGRGHRQQWQSALVVFVWAGLTGLGLSYLVFGCLGQVPGDPVRILWGVLQGILALTTLSISLFLLRVTRNVKSQGEGMTALNPSQWRWHPWLLFPWVSTTLILTLYLRLYPPVANVYPLVNVGIGLGVGISLFIFRRIPAALLAIIAGAAVQTYGLMALWVMTASALLSTGHVGWGVLWAVGVCGLLGVSLWLWRSVLGGIIHLPKVQFDTGVSLTGEGNDE
jgi:hypothetical protein